MSDIQRKESTGYSSGEDERDAARSGALRDSEQRLSLALDSARMGMWEWDVRSDRSVWNAKEYELLGLPVGDGHEPAGAFFSCIHPEDLPALQSSLAKVMESGSEWHHDCRVLRADGGVRWLAGAGRLYRDPEGKPLRMLGVNYDITERKKTEAALRESRAKLDAALASMTDAVFISDNQGFFVDFNDAFATFHRFRSKQECLKSLSDYTHILDVFTADGTPVPLDMWAAPRALRGETGTNAEYLLRRKDTGESWVGSYSFAPIRDKDGVIVGSVVTGRDITEHKQATEALARSAALAEANRHKDDFIAMLGHELRNPLASIRNTVTRMKRSSASPAQEEPLSLIERQITHLTRLIDDLLDVTRVERGKVGLRTAEFDLAQRVRTLLEDHRPLLEAQGLACCFTAPPGPLWALGDSERIAQVVSNLLVNAIKFTDSGGCISVDLASEGGGVAVLTIRDTGIGMDAETLRSIFQPFAQADRSIDRSRGGLGLGLSVVRGLVELHGGSVHASSPGPGKGSEFQIRLPLLISGPKEAPPAPEVAAPSGRSRRVLIVEDNAEIATSLKALLEDCGHQVAVAYAALEGLQLARTHRPDLLLCDIGLPGGMSGYDVARAMRTDPELRSAYLVAMTGYGQERDRQEAQEAGFDLHLTKPVDFEDLERLLAQPPEAIR